MGARLAERDGGLAAAGVVETPEQELKRLRRENTRLKDEQAFPKTSRCTSRRSRGERSAEYACIARHLDEFEVRLMCQVLDVSPSGYYASRKRSPCARAIADERLMLNVRIAHAKSGGLFGAPRVQRNLDDDGIHVGTKRVGRLMRDDGLVGRAPRRRGPVATDSAHADPIALNLLNRAVDVNGIAVNPV